MTTAKNVRPGLICWRRWMAAVQNVHTKCSRTSRQITLRSVVKTRRATVATIATMFFGVVFYRRIVAKRKERADYGFPEY